ncbi:hydrogenase formation protein HypD [Clostridium amazonitimonense]|uniref:hydrogenase formation protein HypD n=1 Tax=Clostridium amazonitimonense TaxID=1499689 RepID=UPI000509FFD4|nr:hydrogenase formation protein HypD [Clostridium amazonitimonense]
MMNIKDNKSRRLINKINEYTEYIGKENINIMEVCGTHTNSIAKYGISSVISNKINLLAGPGCPVCVTNEEYIDAAVYLASKDITIITFGDLIKVKGSNSSLSIEKSKGWDIRIIYSISEVINIAEEIYPKNAVFLGVGFETTAPLIASIIKETYRRKVKNLYFLTSIKTMPPILEEIFNNKNRNIHGIICPGNVAVIGGEKSFKFIYEKYKIPSVICGFNPEEILGGICFLLKDIYRKNKDKSQVGFENLYRKWVSDEGNKICKDLIKDVFVVEDVVWRGIGNVRNSALIINDKYAFVDAVKKFNLQKFFSKDTYISKDKGSCRCGDVLLGNIHPFQCKLFKNVCNPENPCGPCMVSAEGTCATHYKYSIYELKL